MRTLFSAGLILIIFASSVFAAPVVWQLDNVVLDDGNEITGQFTYDSDTNTYSEIAITSPEWWYLFPAYTFTSTNSFSDADELSFLRGTYPPDLDGSHYLSLFFESDLTNQGGSIFLILGHRSREEYDDTNIGGGVDYRYVVSGSVSAIPIPAAVWLFGSGLGLLGWFRRRKTA
jgi:hypothetical protein